MPWISEDHRVKDEEIKAVRALADQIDTLTTELRSTVEQLQLALNERKAARNDEP